LYPKLKKGEYRGVFSLFQIKVDEHFAAVCIWYGRGDHHALHVSIGAYGKPNALLPVPGKPIVWENNKHHHVAFTWKGKQMFLYADGQRIGNRAQAISLSGKLAGQHLLLGRRKFRDSPIIVHAVRVSSIARDVDKLIKTLPVPDTFTLLLDRFDSPEKNYEANLTNCEVISGFNGEAGGRLRGSYHWTETPTKGIALWKRRE
jgi:hypothetical protein